MAAMLHIDMFHENTYIWQHFKKSCHSILVKVSYEANH
jgi:hypothetical protein